MVIDRKKHSASRTWIVGLVAVGVASLIIVAVTTTSLSRQEAESFIRVVTALRVGQDSAASLESLTTKFPGAARNGSCDLGNCTYFFDFDNYWLYRLHLASYTRLTCTLTAKGGKFYSRMIDFVSGSGPKGYAAVIREEPHLPEGMQKPFHVSRQWSGARWRVYVDLTPEASADEHRAAYSLNVGCLSKLGGCKDAHELLPQIPW